ncbi:MAG TPA: DUF58 domain-containing protein [Terriglobales bacterium]|nr:DUF58 domain-containing protein [Terriglobales bacterium]
MKQFLRNALANLDREAWIRFFGALIGLFLAFAAALFSTVTRQQGNELATAVLASFSLLMAGIVGLTTVPYLARRVGFRRMRDALDYEVTREGLAYMAVVFLIGVAALNTGNNLLFIIVSALLAAILISGVASAVVPRSLQLEVTLPEHVFANQGVLARIVLRNVRRFLPAFSVSVVPLKLRRRNKLTWERSLFAFPPHAKPEKQWFRLPDLAARVVSSAPEKAEILASPVYFPMIPAGRSAYAQVELCFTLRGRYVQDGFGLSTRFPFSFLVKTLSLPTSREMVVYPPVEPTDELFEVLPMITGEFESFQRGRGYDLYRIREYSDHDSARHVDWKATAKTGSLMVREFTREDERRLRLVFDNPPPGQVSAEGYERGVNLAASLAWHFASEDTELSFAAPGYTGGAEVYDFLRYLALIAPQPSNDILADLPLSDDFNLVFTWRPQGSISSALWACSYVVFLE